MYACVRHKKTKEIIMKKRFYALALLLALLPMSIIAQTTVTDPESGLQYLDDGDGKLYVNISDGNTTYFKNTYLKTNLRMNLNGGNTNVKLYKEKMDSYTELDLTSTTNTHNQVTDYTGIAYFRNLKTLTVTNSATGTVTMDVSTFTNIEKVIVKGTVRNFTFKTADTNSVKKTLDVSGCTYTSSRITCTGKGIETLILNNGTTSFKGSTLTLTDSGVSGIVGLETLTNLTTLDISGTKIGGVLDLRSNTNLTTLNIKHTPIEELNAEGLTSLSTITIKPDRDYLGDRKYYNYDPETGEGTRLKKINVKGCTSLSKLEITDETGGNHSHQWYQRTVLEELNAEGCTNLSRLISINGNITKLNVRGTKLSYVALIQNKLDEKALIEGGLAACPLITVNVYRNRLKTADFLTTPSYDAEANQVWPDEWITWADEYKRTQALCDVLKKLLINGGSYVKRNYLGSSYDPSTYTGPNKVESKDGQYYEWWIDPGCEYTNNIEKLNLDYVKLEHIFCADNLLTTLDLTNSAATLKRMEICNNLFTTLDLSMIDKNSLENNYCEWRHHVAFKDLKVLKGGVQQNTDGSYTKDTDGACIPDVMREDGENDMIFLPLDNDAADMTITELKVGTEDLSDTRTDAHNYDEAVEGDEGKMDIIHLKEGEEIKLYMKTHDGEIHKHSDIDMHRMVVDYLFDSGMQNADSGEKNKNIHPVIHTDPYVVYLNPIFRSPYDEIDYYSGTVCVSYQWEVPKGIEAYIAVGVNDVKLITDKGTTAADGQLNLVCIGKEGDIIPKNVAVYLKTVPAFENVYKSDGTTPAKTFEVDGKHLSHVAGFYALQNNWEPKYLGWRNTKGGEEDVRLYIEKEGPTKATVKGKYVTIDGVSTEITDDLLYNRNLLKCYKVEDDTPTEAIYYDTFDTEHKYHYNFLAMSTVDNDGTTPLRDNILALGRETKIGTKMIGFWPYIGSSSVPPHRCYIKISDVLNPSSPSSPGLNSLSRGLTFHFDNSAETGVKEFTTVEKAETKDNAWYTLSGMRLQEKPTQPGMYINNGKKVYVK